MAAQRRVADELSGIIEGLAMEVVPVTSDGAQHVSRAYGQWGKGVHPAGLNFGDCFAYEAARTRGCRLLYVGKNFGKTDITGVLETNIIRSGSASDVAPQ